MRGYKKAPQETEGVTQPLLQPSLAKGLGTRQEGLGEDWESRRPEGAG